MTRGFFLALVLLLATATAAEAGPIIGLVKAGAALFKAITATALGAAAVGVAKAVGVSLLGSYVARRLQRRRTGEVRRGIETRFMTTGGTDPQGFFMGKDAVAGHLVYANSHGSGSSMLTRVVEYSDLPRLKPARVIVDGAYSELGTTPHPEYGLPVLSKRTGEGADRGWVKFYDGTHVAADPGLVSRYANDPERPWTADHVGTGLCYAVWTWQEDQGVHRGPPETLVEWYDLPMYDPRADSSVGGVGPQRWNNPSTWQPRDNPVVMLYNIKRGIITPTGEVWGHGSDPEDLPLSNWIAAMNVCDEIEDGRPRFRAGRYVAFEEAPNDVEADLLEACAGQLAELGGTWWIQCGDPPPPVIHITDADIMAEALDFDPLPGLQSVYNGAVVTCRSPEALWQPRELPRIENPAWRTEDRTDRIADLALSAVYDSGQGGQLGLSLVRDSRRWRRHVVTLPPRLAWLRPLQTLSWTSTLYSYSSKIFQIGAYTIDPLTLRVTVELRERDPQDFVPDPAFEFPDPPAVALPVFRLPSPLPGFDAGPAFITDEDGNQRRPAILVTWNGDALKGGPAEVVQIQWRLLGRPEEFDTPAVAAQGRHLLQNVLPARPYEVRGRQVGRGLDAPWTGWVLVTTPDVRLGMGDLPEGATLPFVVTQLPLEGQFIGQLVFLTSDDNLYKWTETGWRIIVDASPTGISGQVFLYKRSVNQPPPPVGGNYDFSIQDLDPAPTGEWSLSIPPGEEAVWITQALALAEDFGSISQTLSWSTPRLFLAGGLNGEPGISTFLATIFRRASTAPAQPSGGSFNFGTGSLSAPSGWSTTIPSGTMPLWATTYLFVGPTPASVVAGGQWGAPREIARNGEDGEDGEDAVSTFVYPVYRRAGAPPAAPSGGLWNFGTNTGTPPTGWFNAAPTSGTGLVYQSTALAVIQGSTGIDSSLVWSTPVAIEGRAGTDGNDGSDARLLRLAATGQAFTFSGANEPAPSFQTISFTASFENMSGTPSWSSSPSVTLGGSGITRTLSVANFGTNDRVTITASLSGVSDSITVYRLREGESAYAVTSTNEAHTLPANSAGTVSSFAGSETTLTAFFGTATLAFQTSGPSANRWRIMSVTNGPGVSGPTSTGSATVGPITGLSGDTGWRDITVRVRGPGSAATQQDIVKRQTFSKSRAGGGGLPGAQGDRGPGRWYIPTSSNGSGALPSSSSAVQTLWTAAFGTSFTPRPQDQVIVYRGTLQNQSSNRAFIRNAANTTWVQQAEFVDGDMLITGSVTAGAFDTESMNVAGLAVFGGNLRSANFVSGPNGDGFIFRQDGSGELGTLLLRRNAVTIARSMNLGPAQVVSNTAWQTILTLSFAPGVGDAQMIMQLDVRSEGFGAIAVNEGGEGDPQIIETSVFANWRLLFRGNVVATRSGGAVGTRLFGAGGTTPTQLELQVRREGTMPSTVRITRGLVVLQENRR